MNNPDIIRQISQGIATFLSPLIIGLLNEKLKSRIKSKNIEQTRLDQLSSFLAFDVTSRSRLIVEQQFRTIFGSLYEYGEILCALRGKSPLKALTLMRAVRHLTVFDHVDQRFVFVENYSTESQRIRRRWLFFVAYVAAVYAAFWPWYFSLSGATHWSLVTFLLISTIIFLGLAWAALGLATDIRAAERFMSAIEPFLGSDLIHALEQQNQPLTTVAVRPKAAADALSS